MFELDDEEFKEVVAQAIDGLPEEFRAKLDNVEVVVEELPSRDVRGRFPRRGLVLGLYQGVPHKARTTHYGLVLPDRISLYKRNIERISTDRREVYRQIRKTLLHEIGHHFSLSDKDLRDIGW
jgi:predicted Zn-dependent protease with MMP-like domain